MLSAAPPAIYTLALDPPAAPVRVRPQLGRLGLSALLGPLLGSLLASGPGSRSVFAVELVPLAVTLSLALAGTRGVIATWRRHRLARAGPVLLALATLALLIDQRSPSVPILLFLWHQQRSLAGRISPTTRPGRRVTILVLATGIAFMGCQAYVVLDLQSGAGWSVAATAVPLVGATVAWTIGSVGAAPLHLDPVRQLVIGHVFVVAGCGLMALPVDGGSMVAIGITVAGSAWASRARQRSSRSPRTATRARQPRCRSPATSARVSASPSPAA